MAKDLITVLNDIIDAIDGQTGSNENVDDIFTALEGIANAIRNSGGGGSGGDYVPRDQHGYNANKYLKVDEDGYVIPVFPSLSDCDRVDIDEVGAIIGDAIVLTYNSTGDWVWSNIPLVFECNLAESDFGGSTTYTYLDPITRRGENDIEFMLENGSRIQVNDAINMSPAMFSVGYILLNDGASDDHAQLLYEVWFIDMTQGSSPLVVRKFRKTYISDADEYYYVEVT